MITAYKQVVVIAPSDSDTESLRRCNINLINLTLAANCEPFSATAKSDYNQLVIFCSMLMQCDLKLFHTAMV